MSDNSQKQASSTTLLSSFAEGLKLDEKTPIDATAWFLGPKAENKEHFLKFIQMAANSLLSRSRSIPEGVSALR